MKKIVILLTLCGFLLNANAAFAAYDDEFLVIGDLAIARPLGIVVTVAGSALFVVSLPFALTSGSVNNTADKLVGEPFRFTFKRPLGDFKQSSPLKPVKTEHNDRNTPETMPAERK
ncbi:MAG: hypothetical protein RDU01_01875 [Thermodesulfovibrionales bacterium]|nr:hypothetical protein [Thermodesulfovibrionales bacterium]